MCDRDTIQFVMFTVWMFTFVGASRGHLCDSTAFLLLARRYPSAVLAMGRCLCVRVSAISWYCIETAGMIELSFWHTSSVFRKLGYVQKQPRDTFLWNFIPQSVLRKISLRLVHRRRVR